MSDKMIWPDGKQFAFTIFDDTDAATVENVGPVYDFLTDLGFRTTKSCWLLGSDPGEGFGAGQSCDDADYARWLVDLQARGFEIAWHNSSWTARPRKDIIKAFDRFASLFHHDPQSGANHSDGEAIYWGESRLTGVNTWLYRLLNPSRGGGKHRCHIEGDEHFWGDLCRDRIRYYRNFVFSDINTLKACPIMPYHDPLRPYVNHWFASSEGSEVKTFCQCLSEENQDRLEREGGACIMYSHLAFGFKEKTGLNARFQTLMKRLAAKNGWFVPVHVLLDYLLKVKGSHEITAVERRRLERRWLWEKLFVGTT